MTHRYPHRIRYFEHDPSGPHTTPKIVDRVTITGSAPGQLIATAYDANGVAISNVPVAWSSDHIEYATVGQTGFVVAGPAHGTAHITATVDGRGYVTAVTT